MGGCSPGDSRIVRAMNVAGIATVASQGAWILLMSGIVLLLIHVVTKDTIRAS